MSAAVCRLEQDLADRLVQDLGPSPDADAIAGWVKARFERISELAQVEAEFGRSFQAAVDEDERRRAILHLAATLGASPRELARDARAFGHYFDRGAVVERARRLAGEEERAAVYGLDRLGTEGAAALSSVEAGKAIGLAWIYPRDARLREAGFRCIRRALEQAPGTQLAERMLWPVQRAALQLTETAWVQNEALTILALASPASATEALRRRLSEPGPGDDIFVRRQAVRLMAATPALGEARSELLTLAAADPSAAVRQCLADVLWRCGASAVETHAPRLARDDDPKVRAMLLLRCPKLGPHGRELLAASIRDDNAFVLRTALHTAAEWAWAVDPPAAAEMCDALGPPVLELRIRHHQRAVRALAAAAAERLWCAGDPDARALAERIRTGLASVKEGRTVTIDGLADEAASHPERVGRVLGVLAQHDFGLELLSNGRLRRGELIAFRSWRALHEWRNPSSDKRPAFRHWIGRVWRGRMVAPSAIMAELAPTKVPGEPLFQPDEGDWRPWLPLPDMILSAIDSGETVSLITAEGVTQIEPKRGFADRLRGRLRITWRFAELAGMRNWSETSGRAPSGYADALRGLGVTIRLRPHPGRELDPQVARFFSFAPAALLGIPALWEQAQVYFSSLYANTLAQLGVFLAAAAGWFLINHWLRTRDMRRARAALPLVVGGWGTRGKSGTERLKAAVFSALGHPIISKTTGNEAMFLHSAAFGELREMFLFRPYDKATIWEQLDLAVLARKLGAKIFLWECMGLTPAYVKVLQRHWMRDDIATITNTYPDHEDVQGPAGRNIPEVMTNFIPEQSSLITSEEQMRPILIEAARELGTSFAAVGWLEAGLIPDEFLTRFPYEEHPYNIALVTAMAAEIGIAPDVAVKEMADRVVQDIGALKVYPEALVRGRRLEFVLGNSANERFGALGNWTRLGFNSHDPVLEPNLWITTVVNNRADRVPRSRVFASILVKDISADRHVLIGSNLEGFQGFIAKAWAELAPSLTLSPPDRPDADPLEELESLAKRFRIVHQKDQLTAIVEVMRTSGRPDEDGIAEHTERCREQLAAYQAIESQLCDCGVSPELNRQLQEQLCTWFQQKIVVVDNYHASGEQIVRLLADMTPPGFRNRIMGMQNIKGTGLDFVYRWHAWEVVHLACADASSGDQARQQRGLQSLATFREFGVLSEERVRATLEWIRHEGAATGEITESQLDLIASQLEEQLSNLDRSSQAGASAGRSKWIDALEAILDAGDAVRRRKKADRIYHELAAERISSDRAIAELKALTSRQKGGWLRKDLTTLLAR
ncbi:MAG: hypothetical protein ABIS23_04645 [Sphingomicrobium sp.]